MLAECPRAVLERLISNSGDDYSSVSRLLGRNSAYIQQFIKRGTPKVLAEIDRGILARYFGVDEAILGAPARQDKATLGQITIPIYDLSAPGGFDRCNNNVGSLGSVSFDKEWLRELTASEAFCLSILRMAGDSMSPTLLDGDLVMIDVNRRTLNLIDGIYVVRMSDNLNVKRIAINPSDDCISLLNDNPVYPKWNGLKRETVDIVGRVLWLGRNIR